jgi:hypothetical protein
MVGKVSWIDGILTLGVVEIYWNPVRVGELCLVFEIDDWKIF